MAGWGLGTVSETGARPATLTSASSPLRVYVAPAIDEVGATKYLSYHDQIAMKAGPVQGCHSTKLKGKYVGIR